MDEQSFMKAAFFGVIAEDVIFPYPLPSEEERSRVQALLEGVRGLFEGAIDAAVNDERGEIDAAEIQGVRELGLFGLSIPSEFGGLGLSITAQARVIQEVAAHDLSLALVLVVHGAICAKTVLDFGTDEQKRELVPLIARGDMIAAFALTERQAGSDAGVIRTHAAYDSETRGYVLNGEKPWVTSGRMASLFVVFARTSRPEEGHKPRLTAFVVKKGPGVELGETHETLGVRASGLSEVRFSAVRLGPEAVIGERGKGFKVAMAVLSDARPLLSAALVGQCRALVDLTVKRLRKRRSFGRVIGEFPIMKDKIAKMMSDTFAIESMTYLTTGIADRGVEDYSLESAICRVASAETLWRVVNDAMQAAAGSGYVKPSPLGRYLRDARAGFVIDGTNETLRCFIALSGLRGPGERISEVVSAMYEPVKGFGLLRDFALRKVREALRRERMSRASPLLSRESVVFEEATEELARVADRALREHGREIAEMQYPQMRIANVAIDLYALAACISRTTQAIELRGESGARRQLDLCTMFDAAAEGRMRSNIEKLEHNDDELRKLIAARTYTDGGYPFDAF
jgi:acyl-CoA dehydrogenase family protein 9